MTIRRQQLPPLTLNAWLRFEVIRAQLSRLQDVHSVIEVGCGQGALGTWLASRFEYTGYETDETSWRIASRRLAPWPRAHVHNRSLPAAPTGTCDLLVAFEVLEHIESDVEALRDWARWIRPGGYLMLSVPAHPSRFSHADRAAGHFRRYEKEQLLDRARAAGYMPLAAKMYGGPLGYLLECGRNILLRDYGSGESFQNRTSASGRLFQSRDSMAALTMAVTAPFRILQRAFEDTDFGTGIVLLAVRR